MQEVAPAAHAQTTPKQCLSAFVYSEIAEGIFDGTYAVGDRLPTEEKLAQQFAVSRVTVRHALEKLRACRMIVSLQGSGNYVGGLPLSAAGEISLGIEQATLPDILEYRVALETEAAALAAEHRTDADIKRLKMALASHDSRGEPSLEWLVQRRVADLLFHEAVREASANPILIKLLTSICPLYSMLWLTSIAGREDRISSVAERFLAEHATIANAIIARDSELARVTMRFHIQHAYDDLD